MYPIIIHSLTSWFFPYIMQILIKHSILLDSGTNHSLKLRGLLVDLIMNDSSKLLPVWKPIICVTAMLTRCDVGSALNGRWGGTQTLGWAVMCRASLIQYGWNSFCLSGAVPLQNRGGTGGRAVSTTRSSPSSHFPREQHLNSVKLSISETCPKTKRLPFPVKIHPILNQPLCLHLAFKIFVNFINITDKLGDVQITTEINQALQFFGKKNCFVFWLVPQTAAPICHYDWEHVTTICFYCLGRKNNILLSSSHG